MRKAVLLSVVAVAAFLLAGDQAQAFWGSGGCKSRCSRCSSCSYSSCHQSCYRPCHRSRCNRCSDPCHRRCGLFRHWFKRNRCCHQTTCSTCGEGTLVVPDAEPLPAPSEVIYAPAR